MTKCRITWCKEEMSDAKTRYCKQHKVVSEMLLLMFMMWFGCIFAIISIPLAFKHGYFDGIFFISLTIFSFVLVFMWTFFTFKKMKQVRIETEMIPNGA